MSDNGSITHLSQFVLEAGKLTIEVEGNRWKLRQPTAEEMLDAESAYRLEYDRIMADKRLRQLAGTEAALQRQASKRANAAEALYMLPVLLENEQGRPVFDVFDEASMQRFETTAPSVAAAWTAAYFRLMRVDVEAVKKK